MSLVFAVPTRTGRTVSIMLTLEMDADGEPVSVDARLS